VSMTRKCWPGWVDKVQRGLAFHRWTNDLPTLVKHNLEVPTAGLRRDIAHFDEGAAEENLRLDRLVERVARIGHHLELAD
jgi:hypothetical protein